MAFFFFTLRRLSRNQLRGSRRRYIFLYFRFDVWPVVWTEALFLISQHTTYEKCNLASNITYVMCVNFIHKWRDLLFKVDSERQMFLINFSWQFFFTLRVFSRILLRGSSRRNIIPYFRFDIWPGVWTEALRLISEAW